MTTIEHLTPREVRAAIREQLAKMPPTVDANGWGPGETHMAGPLSQPAPGGVLQPVEPVEPGQSSTPGRPLPDHSQGYQGISTQPRPLTPRQRIAAQIRMHDHI